MSGLRRSSTLSAFPRAERRVCSQTVVEGSDRSFHLDDGELNRRQSKVQAREDFIF